jgi:hypothetical protein
MNRIFIDISICGREFIRRISSCNYGGYLKTREPEKLRQVSKGKEKAKIAPWISTLLNKQSSPCKGSSLSPSSAMLGHSLLWSFHGQNCSCKFLCSCKFCKKKSESLDQFRLENGTSSVKGNLSLI